MTTKERPVFIFVCTRCGKRHFSTTNFLPPFVTREHKKYDYCKQPNYVKVNSKQVYY